MKKVPKLLAMMVVLLVLMATAVRGQSALDGFDPNANNAVNTIAVQADGKIVIGGYFTSVLGVTRNHIARLNPDGTLDTAFNPNANGFGVASIAVQATPFGSEPPFYTPIHRWLLVCGNIPAHEPRE